MKNILVTGALGGIGLAIVKELKVQGHTVIAVGQDEADVTKTEDIERLSASNTEKIDWVICSHGYIDPETNLERQKPKNIEKTFDVNLLSLFYIAQIFLPRIKEGMVFISSTAGLRANGKHVAYSASKAGVNSFAQGLARNRENLIFISLCPGPTDTAMRERIGAPGGQDPVLVAKLTGEIISSRETYKSGDVVSIRDGKIQIESRV